MAGIQKVRSKQSQPKIEKKFWQKGNRNKESLETQNKIPDSATSKYDLGLL